MNAIRYASGFSGIGGFDLALDRLGFERVWSCDWNPEANQVYYKRFKPKRGTHYSGDIRRVNPEEIPDHDLFCAGFPCPSFSVAGTRKGFKDKRGEVFFEIPRIAKVKRPKMLLLENVKGLLNHDEGRTFTIILQSLDELGYWIEWQVLNSKYFGVPQTRERVFIIGHLRGTGGREIFPIPESSESPYFRDTGEQIASALQSPGHAAGNYRGMNMIIQRVPLKFLNRNQKNIEGDYSFTVDSINTGGIFDGLKIRRFTPVECERLQGFPDGWTKGLSDSSRYRVLGKAVTVNVIEFLGELIKSCFTNKEAIE